MPKKKEEEKEEAPEVESTKAQGGPNKAADAVEINSKEQTRTTAVAKKEKAALAKKPAEVNSNAVAATKSGKEATQAPEEQANDTRTSAGSKEKVKDMDGRKTKKVAAKPAAKPKREVLKNGGGGKTGLAAKSLEGGLALAGQQAAAVNQAKGSTSSLILTAREPAAGPDSSQVRNFIVFQSRMHKIIE